MTNHQDKELSSDKCPLLRAMEDDGIVDIDPPSAASPQLPVAEQPAGRAAVYPTFAKGQMIESKTHGLGTFLGMDEYMGETTYMFESSHGIQYWLPRALKTHLHLESAATHSPVAQMSGDVPTPRTDAILRGRIFYANCGDLEREVIDHCRQLERELASHPSNAAGQDAPKNTPVAVLTAAQLAEALEFIAPDMDADQLESEAAIYHGEGHSGRGYYCAIADYPDEGSIFLDGSTIKPREPVATVPQVVQAPSDDRHHDDKCVDAFAIVMKAKLASARRKGRGGWEQCDPADLSHMLREHVEKGDPRDVANFCMFLWCLNQPIAAPQPVAASPSIVPSDEQRNLLERLQELEDASEQRGYNSFVRRIIEIRTLVNTILTTASNAGEAKQGDKS